MAGALRRRSEPPSDTITAHAQVNKLTLAPKSSGMMWSRSRSHVSSCSNTQPACHTPRHGTARRVGRCCQVDNDNARLPRQLAPVGERTSHTRTPEPSSNDMTLFMSAVEITISSCTGTLPPTNPVLPLWCRWARTGQTLEPTPRRVHSRTHGVCVAAVVGKA